VRFSYAQEEWMAFREFLQYAANPGVNVIVGFVLSFVAEWIPGYDGVSAKLKRLYMMLLCFVVPVLATFLLGQFDQEAVWMALMAGFTAFFGSQASHVRKLD